MDWTSSPPIPPKLCIPGAAIRGELLELQSLPLAIRCSPELRMRLRPQAPNAAEYIRSLLRQPGQRGSPASDEPLEPDPQRPLRSGDERPTLTLLRPTPAPI